MSQLKHALIEQALSLEVLRFGEFTLKSGRLSPYFFNAGLFNTGSALSLLGQCYAQTIQENNIDFDMCFGPAYKGIPLVTSAAMTLSNQLNRDVPFAYNRKEAKNHGEGGVLVGAPVQGHVLILDDVMTAGTAVNEAVGMIQAQGAEIAGIAIIFDRQEKGQADKSATQELAERLGCPVVSVITFSDLILFIEQNEAYKSHLPKLNDYRAKYGIG